MKSDNLLKLENSIRNIAPEGKFALAYSGGVDSSILLAVARGMGLDVLPLTFDFQDSLKVPEVRENGKERCYYCKSNMMKHLRTRAREQGYDILCDGTNADDRKQYRPGLRALEELGVRSPIGEAGITKEELRAIGRELGLPVASKPSSPCLLTRFPYDTYVTDEMIAAVGTAEKIVKGNGYEACRVRVFGSLSKIEIPKAELPSALEKDSNIHFSDKVLDTLKPIGVTEVIFDPKGLRSGTMDETE